MPAAFFHEDEAYWAPEAHPEPMPAIFFEVGMLKPAPRVGHTFGLEDGLPNEFMNTVNPVACKVIGHYDQYQKGIVDTATHSATALPQVLTHKVENDWRHKPKDQRTTEFSLIFIIAGNVPHALDIMLKQPGFFHLCDEKNIEISRNAANRNYRRNIRPAQPSLEKATP